MRKYSRAVLDQGALASLAVEQQIADGLRRSQKLNVHSQWKKARKRVWMKDVLKELRGMAGGRVRCMYCLDSFGSDIEHFKPKAVYPETMFQWANLLLCCSVCGNYKGDRFSIVRGKAQLIDPTSEEPWDHLDFDPVTGTVTARFNLRRKAFCARGEYTVRLLRLDQREELSEGYLRSWRRICRVFDRLLGGEDISPQDFVAELRLADDHGLVDWCFGSRGISEEPMTRLYRTRRDYWLACAELLV